MVLVDTSVWIRFLANKSPFATELLNLLEQQEVAAHDLVYGELLIGDLGARRNLLQSYSLIQKVPTVSHHEVVEFVNTRKLHGTGIGWTDAHLLASSIVSSIPLWSADRRLTAIAAQLRINYRSQIH